MPESVGTGGHGAWRGFGYFGDKLKAYLDSSPKHRQEQRQRRRAFGRGNKKMSLEGTEPRCELHGRKLLLGRKVCPKCGIARRRELDPMGP